MTDEERRREAESKRLLERVRRDSQTSFFSHTASSARDHMTAKDADQNDWPELWGKRVGRALAAVAAIVLIGWLFSFLTRGG